ncbi:MAG: biotin/lipoyl-containing protein [Chloroflexota bacterium]
MKYQATINDKQYEIEITPDGDLFVDGKRRTVDFLSLGETLYSVIAETDSHEVLVGDQDAPNYEVQMHGRLYNVRVMDERSLLLSNRRGGDFTDSGEVVIKAPMPGLIVDVPVTEGETVEKGQTVVILESMKMQNELKAPREGTVQRIGASAGESVEQNKILITIT